MDKAGTSDGKQSLAAQIDAVVDLIRDDESFEVAMQLGKATLASDEVR